LARVPPNLPTAVRVAATMTMSSMKFSINEGQIFGAHAAFALT
jgi:hypothetical protein